MLQGPPLRNRLFTSLLICLHLSQSYLPTHCLVLSDVFPALLHLFSLLPGMLHYLSLDVIV